MRAIGVDGCRSGWFYFSVDGNSFEHGVVASLAALVETCRPTDRLFVDIPIGLTDDGAARGCDTAARKVLAERRSSVFPAPARGVLHAASHEQANDLSLRVAGKKISNQTFAILPKIREVDALMRQSQQARRIVREVHPEVCFWAFAGGRSMAFKKKSEEGFQERVATLAGKWQGAEIAMATAYFRSSGSGVARDDVVDAMAAAVTAMAPAKSLATLPEMPARDTQGLPMEMVYLRQ